MLRLTCESGCEGQVTVRLEGEISGRWVEELRRECDRVLAGAARTSRRLVLDLVGVSFIDGAGLALFRELAVGPLAVKNCSAYVAELLKDIIDVGTAPDA